jgi:hypothetical protein
MATKKKTVRPAAKKASAGKRDLSAAVAKVHDKGRRIDPDAVPADLSKIDPLMLVTAGDAPGRKTYFELDDDHRPSKIRDKKVYIVMGQKANLHDYRTLDFDRTHRSMLTIPPKIRESIRELFGVEGNDDYPITTALIALADYGSMVLKRDNKRLLVDGAPDPKAAERKAVRKLVKLEAERAKGGRLR